MKYIIMLTIVVGLAAADFLTGIIKGYLKNDVSSKIMRRGGLHKIAEIVIMATACGLEVGMTMLGAYYNADKLADITGTVTASVVFGYIVIMEIISVLENYGEINPDAVWVKKLIARLRTAQKGKEADNNEND